MSGTIPFVYLTSAPFSGSTLFSLLVNTHPEIATVGEMTGPISSQDAENYYCSCGEKIRYCPFWKDVRHQMQSRGFAFDPGGFDTRITLGTGLLTQRIFSGTSPLIIVDQARNKLIDLWPGSRRRLKYLLNRNKALAASILSVTGKGIFFDASKSPVAIRYFARETGVDLRVVHLVRDVRGVSVSRRKNKGEHDWQHAVTHWVRTNRSIERYLSRLPDNRWIRVRYEDLCLAPGETLARFFEFCGVRPHDVPQDAGSWPHHIVGNRMRLTNTGRVQLDERWLQTLSSVELASAQKLAGAMLSRYGYAAD